MKRETIAWVLLVLNLLVDLGGQVLLNHSDDQIYTHQKKELSDIDKALSRIDKVLSIAKQ